WTGFEECCKNVWRWLQETEVQLPQEIELKSTLDEKRVKLQSYRALVDEAVSHQQDRDKIESLPERTDKVDQQLQHLLNNTGT
ncbi:hypothetical protein L9F63_003517, partial [Diploptera punctata]